jgi:hypothetical protein
MQNGRLYDGLRLDEIGNRPRRRPEFYFERPGGEAGAITMSAEDD